MPHRAPTLTRSLISALRKAESRFVNTDSDRTCTTVASYNVHKCVGIDGVLDPARIARVIAELDADILALQEADERTGPRRGLLDLALLEQTTGLVPVYAPTRSRSHGWHGNLILAKAGVVSHVRPLSLPGLEPRGALIVDLEMKGVPLRVIAAHLGLLRQSRHLQTAALLDAAQSADRPTILLGDLNEWRVRTRSSLLSLMPHFGPFHAALPSFPARFPLLALDRILASPASLISRIEVHSTPLSRVASDHLPIKARLDLAHVAPAPVEHALT